MEDIKSKVYVKTDERGRIIRCEGGYTTPADLTGWTQIDEGVGDRYNLAQSNYFPSGLYSPDGVPRYKLVDGAPMERTQAELDADRLPKAKAQRIAQSKVILANYLETHPLQWTDGQHYSITAEKQAQLTGTVVAAQADGQPPEWNSTGGVCREWDVAELAALAVAIKNRVKALVKYQQTQEVAMRNADTLDELDAIVVDYDSVEVTYDNI